MLTVVAFVGLSGTLLDEQQPASMVPPDKSFNAPAAVRPLPAWSRSDQCDPRASGRISLMTLKKKCRRSASRRAPGRVGILMYINVDRTLRRHCSAKPKDFITRLQQWPQQ